MSFKSLFDYFKLCITSKYCSFSGRARRAEFWGFMLFYFIGSVLVNVLSYMIFGGVDLSVDSPEASLQAQIQALSGRQALQGVYNLVLLLPTLGVSVRRLHDTGRSGLWITLPLVSFAVFISSIFFAIFGLLVWLFAISAFVLSISWIVLLVFYCLDSQPGHNQYGPNPKDEDLMPFDHSSSMDYIKQSDNTY